MCQDHPNSFFSPCRIPGYPQDRRGDGTAVAHLVGKDLAIRRRRGPLGLGFLATIDGLELMG